MKVVVMSKTSLDVTQYTGVTNIAKTSETSVVITYVNSGTTTTATVNPKTASVYIMEV